MPNWCDNSATFSHEDKSKIDAIEATLKSDDKKLFQTILPMPDSEAENWYGWNVSNWGTKWDADVIDWERRDDNEIWVSFATAWSPPTNLYEFMNENGYGVSALYSEPGLCFAGSFSDGFDDYYEYDITNQEEIDSIPSDIAEFADLQYYHDQWVEENEQESGE